jgi:hypothetical protein
VCISVSLLQNVALISVICFELAMIAKVIRMVDFIDCVALYYLCTFGNHLRNSHVSVCLCNRGSIFD